MEHLTPEQVEELKDILLSMREQVLKRAQEQIKDPSNVAFEGGDEIDRANIEAERYLLLQRIRTRELKLLRKIDYALMKIEAGTYGICESCGKLIPFERLKARPVTTMCIDCKELEEERENE
ncbi:RNA polymerase-binding protein DksA [Thermocrinis minervae]|uniref:Transcriptional regulator, TraR/DksA family n=1 Tax=Thermocrinis minervae TaxID=381751 RepID=A0A1M6R0P4_9AQUI|nr:RNA polymerase-binding protein DksA [Thermocrinis minervae]SHK26003.1 transcriptional regulator, TraR/DksA family [Thermocrinis minervae]